MGVMLSVQQGMQGNKLCAQLVQSHLVGRAIEPRSLNELCLAEEKTTGLWTTESFATAKNDSICLCRQQEQMRREEDMER